MTFEETISWIFLSIAIASGNSPANFRAISMIADGINHAVPNHKEIQSSISWLMEKNLVLKYSNKYELSEKGIKAFESVSNKNIGFLKMMDKLELILKTF